MTFFATFSAHTSTRLAEIGYLLVAIAGVWLFASQIPALKLERTRIGGGGILLAAAGALLVIATHWGTFR